MTRWLVLAVTAGLLVSAPESAREPTLRTAASSQRHVVVTFAPGDLTAMQVAVATSRAHTANGAFLPANVKLRERISATPDPSTGLVRFETHAALPRGTYYVAVSGALQDPTPSCVPIRSHCGERWSNVLRVVV
jgi:hypothetical protein